MPFKLRNTVNQLYRAYAEPGKAFPAFPATNLGAINVTHHFNRCCFAMPAFCKNQNVYIYFIRIFTFSTAFHF